jgi:cell division protein FtsQ
MVDGTTLQALPEQSNSDTTDNRGDFVMPSWGRYLVYALLAIIVAASVAFAIRSYQNAPNANIYIDPTGLTAAQYQALKATMGTQASGNYFIADIQSMRNIALSLSWVDEVSLVRDWQRGIVVAALPKKAVAKFGTERLVDAEGQVFVPVEPVEQIVTEQQQLVTLQGSKNQAPVIMQQMQQVNQWFAPLDIKVVDIILTPRMTWLIRFDDGLRVIVDNENTAQKLLNLSQLLSNQLSQQRDNIQAVDLRYKNGFTITWHDNADQAASSAAASDPNLAQAADAPDLERIEATVPLNDADVVLD